MPSVWDTVAPPASGKTDTAGGVVEDSHIVAVAL